MTSSSVYRLRFKSPPRPSAGQFIDPNLKNCTKETWRVWSETILREDVSEGRMPRRGHSEEQQPCQWVWQASCIYIRVFRITRFGLGLVPSLTPCFKSSQARVCRQRCTRLGRGSERRKLGYCTKPEALITFRGKFPRKNLLQERKGSQEHGNTGSAAVRQVPTLRVGGFLALNGAWRDCRWNNRR